jgi:cation transporter-like permease
MPLKEERTIQWMLPMKKIVPGDVVVVIGGPRGTKLSLGHLNPVHSNGHVLSTVTVAVLLLPPCEDPTTGHRRRMPL